MCRYTIEVPVEIERQSLSLSLGPGLPSPSPLSITTRLQSHANTISKIRNNKKIRIQNFAVIFKTLFLENHYSQGTQTNVK